MKWTITKGNGDKNLEHLRLSDYIFISIPNKRSYVIAPSLPKLLGKASDVIQQSAIRIQNGEHLYDLSGFTDETIKRNDHFCITVRSCFLYTESSISPANYQYAYEITQSMDKNGNLFYRNARRLACASLFLVLEKVFKSASVSRVVVKDRRFSLVFAIGSSVMINSRRSIVV